MIQMPDSEEIKLRGQKTVSQSRAEQVHIVMPGDVNPSFHLFGGQLMTWIDVVAGVVARRHCGREVITAAVDHLQFLAPARLNDIVVLRGRITFVGNTSMEICVDTFVEQPDMTDSCKHVNRAYLTMVALNHDKKPVSVPLLLPETQEEKADYEEAAIRAATRKKSRGTLR